MATIDVTVPDIGDFDEVSVIEVLVKPGDTVRAEQSLITVESDKASMEIPSSAAGVIKTLTVKLGDKVKQGSVLATLEAAGSGRAAAKAVPAPSAAAPAPVAQSKPEIAQENRTSSAPEKIASPVATSSGSLEVRVPDIGDFKDVAVIEVLVKPGDVIKVEQSLVTVESDKASMEIPSSSAGLLKELRVRVGDKLNVGDVVAVLASTSPLRQDGSPPTRPSPEPGEDSKPRGASDVSAAPAIAQGYGDAAASPDAAVAGAPAARLEPTAALAPHEPSAPTGDLPHASPSVRKFARELGVPLAEVKGGGPKGRILMEDVQNFTRAVMAGDARTQAAAAKAPPAAAGGGAGLDLLPWPKVDFAKFGAVERRDLSRIKKISGANLHRNWVVIPHVTNHDDADITELEAFRLELNKENEKAGIKVTMLAFLIKAAVSALKKFPDFNSSLDGDQLVLKRYFHIGFAADTPNGLVVPVIRDADQKGVLAIGAEMNELAKKAREGKLTPGEMQGSCFSISSLGGIGGRYFTPIINAPEVAILGVSKSAMEPVWNGRDFAPRLMLPLSLSWDHRVVDGASAARFNAHLCQILADFRRVLL